MKIDLERGTMIPDFRSTDAIAPPEKEGDFGEAVRSAFESVDATAKDADQAAAGLVTGEVEIHEAMIRMEKADLMLKLGATVRTKMLDAYNKLLTSAGS
jgi:flagellar hook-basal body complex protein FliE